MNTYAATIGQIALGAFAAGALLIPLVGYAQRHVLYPGVMCSLRGDHLRAGHEDVLRVSQFGYVGNGTADGDPDSSDIGAFDLDIVCPIPRQRPERSNGVTVNIRFRDTEAKTLANTRFCCQLHNGDPNGSFSDFTDASTCRDAQIDESTAPPGFGDLLREIKSSNSDGNIEGWAAGVYMLHCTLPPGVFLIDYAVREN
jgi:hypothetical protein